MVTLKSNIPPTIVQENDQNNEKNSKLHQCFYFFTLSVSNTITNTILFKMEANGYFKIEYTPHYCTGKLTKQ